MTRGGICQLCRQSRLTEVLDLGLQPISNRFRRTLDEAEARFPLALAQCEVCGLTQLRDPPPADALIAPFDWLSYNEPEGHLDRLARQIAESLGKDGSGAIWGLSFKDDTLLNRLRPLGFQTYRIDPLRDLAIEQPGAGVESVQQRLDSTRVRSLIAAHGRPRMIVARHILEHVHDLQAFLGVMRELLVPGGFLVIEAPDCEPSFRQLDYTIVWEEHVAYHTRGTLPGVFAAGGMEMLWSEVLPLGHESLLVAIGRLADGAQTRQDPEETRRDKVLLASFGSHFAATRERFADALAEYQNRNERVAVLGAGHLACAFVNYLGLGELVSMVVDDNPRKQGLYLPGSKLQIHGSSALLEQGVRLCLLSVNPEAERKVIDRNRDFVERGGQFASIFTGSQRALIR